MGTRSGDLDPGILIYLMRAKGFDLAALENLVDHRSGLLGVSGLSGDLRQLHAAERSSPDARLAVAMFGMSVAKVMAGMIVALGGADAIVFTGGAGEHDASVRATIGGHLGWLGVRFADSSNERTAAVSMPGLALPGTRSALPRGRRDCAAHQQSRRRARSVNDP